MDSSDPEQLGFQEKAMPSYPCQVRTLGDEDLHLNLSWALKRAARTVKPRSRALSFRRQRRMAVFCREREETSVAPVIVTCCVLTARLSNLNTGSPSFQGLFPLRVSTTLANSFLLKGAWL